MSQGAKDTCIALIAAVCIIVHLAVRYGTAAPASIRVAPLWIALLVGGIPLVIELVRKLMAGQFGSDLLAGISIVTSVALGEYLAGSIIVLMLSGGAALEQFATRRASSVLDALASRMPQTAHRKCGAGFTDLPLWEVAAGDTLVIFPNEICPSDGVVVEGHGSMDESYLTGEPFHIDKAPGSEVMSGAINGENVLTIIVSRRPEDSRYARIVAVMRASEEKRPQIRRIGDRLGAWYTPIAVLIAAGAWIWSGNPTRFLAVLVLATPCPLLIAIPVAVIGAISLAARRSIIVKNPAILEEIESCRTFIFDKTGTLTYGKPSLTEVLCAPGFSRNEVLSLAASLERYSKHPLAQAIVQAGKAAGIATEPVTLLSEKPGTGLRGVVGSRSVRITGRAKLPEHRWELPPVSTGLECVIMIDEIYAATFRFRDTPRQESRSFVGHLKPRHNATRIILLSGDREPEVRYLAAHVGIQEFFHGQAPEQKVAIIERETRRRKTLYIGDGINDAPAMMASTAAVALGQNSDIASEAAGAVILDASLTKVDELIHIGRRMRRIALESAAGGMALSFAGMLLAFGGLLSPVAGAVAQEFIDLLAILNALRVALPFGAATDFE